MIYKSPYFMFVQANPYYLPDIVYIKKLGYRKLRSWISFSTQHKSDKIVCHVSKHTRKMARIRYGGYWYKNRF